MQYVIMREDGAYVARPGSAASYTRLLQCARTFDNKPAALRECCGNERAVTVESQLNKGG